MDKRVNVRMDSEVIDTLKDLAWQRKMTLSGLLREMIDNYIQKRGGVKKK